MIESVAWLRSKGIECESGERNNEKESSDVVKPISGLGDGNISFQIKNQTAIFLKLVPESKFVPRPARDVVQN
jgi:hypothetical protein